MTPSKAVPRFGSADAPVRNDCGRDARAPTVLAEAEDEGADVGGTREVHVEVGAAGVDVVVAVGIVGGVGVVEGVRGAEEEVALVIRCQGDGAVGADELDGAEAAVRGCDGVAGLCLAAVVDSDAAEDRAEDVVAVRPLHDVGPSGHNRRGILEVEVEGAGGGIEARHVAAVVAVGVKFHHDGTL